MTDCAYWLNGRGIGARYDGTYPGSPYVGDCSMYTNSANWPQSWKNDVRGYIEAQLEVYEANTYGWFFWNFKTEAGTASDWSFFDLQDAGVFPQPLTSREFGSICS